MSLIVELFSSVCFFCGIAKGGAHLMVWRPPVWVG